MSAVTREQIVAAALAWLGTRYVHMADVKGEGVDCAMLLVRVFCDLGVAPAFDPRPYAQQWYMHRSDEVYLGWIAKYAHQVESPQPADLALYRVGRCVSHGAIVIPGDAAIHAYAETRCVETRALSEIPNLHGFHFHSYWSVFP